MKYSAVAVAALVAVASAQDISTIPSCAMPCIEEAAVAIGCASDDYTCICENKAELVSAATICVVNACTAPVAIGKSLLNPPFSPSTGPLNRFRHEEEHVWLTCGLPFHHLAGEVVPATNKFCDLVLANPPKPSEPAPSVPAPSVPAPSVPAPSVPAPSDPAPSVPAPSEPVPSAPQPSASAPVEPPSSAPAPSVTPAPSGQPSASGVPPSSSGIATAGAAIAGSIGSFGMLVLGALAAL